MLTCLAFEALEHSGWQLHANIGPWHIRRYPPMSVVA
jgi:hypothetical protein